MKNKFGYTFEKISHFLIRAMLALFLFLLGAVLILSVSNGGRDHWIALIAAILLGVAAYFGAGLLNRGLESWQFRHKKLLVWALLTLLCLLVKTTWILLVRVPLGGDYQVFWSFADYFANDGVYGNTRYIALFPHIFGYSWFLSCFIQLFGAGELLAQLLNVLLTAFGGSFLFLLCDRQLGLGAGCMAYLLWILCPSQTMYNSMVLSEPLYTVLLLAFFLLIGALERRRELSSPVLFGCLSGVLTGFLLRAINAVRPIAAIPLIALAIWLLLLKPGEEKESGKGRMWVAVFGIALVVYFGTGPLWNSYITQRIEEEPATSVGYSLAVGFNEGSKGQWNKEDSDLLIGYSNQPGATAQQAQEQMMEVAKARITSGEIDFPSLLLDKLRVFLGEDTACVSYSGEAIAHTRRYLVACNGFYYCLLILAFLGGLRLWKKPEQSSVLLAPLFVLGLTLAQMLVEVAGRYHYSILPMLILTGQYVLFTDRKDLLMIQRKEGN